MATLDSPSVQARKPVVAIVGNPNAGKTTLFNVLTGSRQKVGNYPGVTVERVSADLNLGGRTIEVVDVPGLYSLDPVSEDEIVAVDVLRGKIESVGKPDLLLCVLDASNLERNLYFFSQLADAGFPMLGVLTLTDVLAQSGASVDLPRLKARLGIDVIQVIGHKKIGLDELKAAISDRLSNPQFPKSLSGSFPEIDAATTSLQERFSRSGLDFRPEEIRIALLTDDTIFQERLQELPELLTAYQASKLIIQRVKAAQRTGYADRYKWAAEVQSDVVDMPEGRRRKSRTDRIDAFLTHRVFGLLFFGLVMYGVFQSIYTLAQPLMGMIETGFAWIGQKVSPLLEGAPILQSLIVDGLIAGVGSALMFLPQIVILFFFIGVLEGTGYLARAAFLMDKCLGWCGLSGRAFIPLLSSFACAIPGIMAARVMPDKKSRLATILVAPLMSCSARLPVYLVLIGAIIEPQFGPGWAGFTLFAMHLLGLLVAIPVVVVLNKGVLKGKRLPFVLELPPYQYPKWRDIWISMFVKGKTFVQTAGTIIVLMSLIIWGLLYFPRSAEADARYAAEFRVAQPTATESEIQAHIDARRMENSLLGTFGRTIEPVFVPAGFDWRLSTAILSAFPAREVVVASMGIIFDQGSETDEESKDLREAIKSATWPDGRTLVTPWTAVGLMVFFALCCQCMATLATVKKETGGWKWPTFMFVYMTALAYIFAVAINQLGLALDK